MSCTQVLASAWRHSSLVLPAILAAGPAMAGAYQPDSAPAPAAGQAGPPATVVEVTWPDIVRLIDQDPRLAAGRSLVDAARAGVDAAGAVPNPTLEGDVGQGSARSGGASRVEWGFALSMPLDWIAQRGSRIDAAEAEFDIAAAQSRELRRDALLQLRVLFWTLAYEQARVATLDGLRTQTSSLVETVRRRVEMGEVRPVEGPRVEIELEKVLSEGEAAITALSARQAELALWLGVLPGKTIVAVADLDALPVVVDRDTALAKALATHPALSVAEARSRSFAAEVDMQRRARVPSLSIAGFTISELDRRASGVGLAVDLPIWNWNSSRIAQARANLAAGRNQAESARREVATTVLETQAACQASILAAARLKNNVVPRSEAVASTMEKAYQLGEASLLDVIDARRTLLDSHRLYLSALVQAQIDCSRLGALIGEDAQ